MQNPKKLSVLLIGCLKVIIVLLFTYYLYNCIKTPDDFHYIQGVDLILHEAGHIIFIFFGRFVNILGGSLNQVLIPFIFSAYFFLRKEIYSGSIVLMWIGESITNVAIYAKDAIIMQLPLLGGDSVIHDWNYLLSTLNILKYTDIIGGIIYYLGISVIVIGAILALYSSFRTKDDIPRQYATM